jgi:hypothetical protein
MSSAGGERVRGGSALGGSGWRWAALRMGVGRELSGVRRREDVDYGVDRGRARLVFLLATPHSALMFFAASLRATSTIPAMRTTPPRAGAGAFVQVHLTDYLQSGRSAAQTGPRPVDAPDCWLHATALPQFSSPPLRNIEMPAGAL